MRIGLFQPLLIYERGMRANQEDYVFPPKPAASHRLFILCDGMGGHAKGEVASRIVAEQTAQALATMQNEAQVVTDAMLAKALEIACQHLDRADTSQDEVRKMGTTFTALCFHKGGCLAAHIGDSRIYHIRPSERRMLYKSKDHSLVCELYEAGEISFSEMSTSSQRNVITRALMPGRDNRVSADITHITDIQAGDYFYLCTDGMLEQMADDELVEILSRNTTDEEKRRVLIAATADNRDNHSAIIIHVASVEAEKDDSQYVSDEATTPYNALLMRKDDEDDEGTITIVDDPQEDDEHTSYAPVQTVPPSQPTKKETKIETRKETTNNNNNGNAGLTSWVVALAVAAIAAACVVAVYYFI